MGDHPKPTVAPFASDNDRGGGVLRLAAENLEKVYKRRRVVRDVSVEIKQGEIVGLLGPNGAGKTTTFYMIVGLVKPDGGRVTLGSEEITEVPMYLRAQLGISYLPQEASVFRKLTVEENLLAVFETMDLPAAERERRTRALLEEFGISHIARNRAYSLSGVNAAAWRSPEASPSTRHSSCSMSPLQESILSPSSRSNGSSPSSGREESAFSSLITTYGKH